MRILAIFVAGACGWSALAAADPSAAELQQQGEELAKQQRYSEAIDKFKAADRLQPTAAHACLIALAYTRREAWPQAEIFLAACQALANENDPLPDWVPTARAQLDERLAAVNVAPVEIEVTPADAKAQLAVSSFAPDEKFPPRTIHLPPGHHVILASAPGYQDTRAEVDIVDKTPQHVVVQMHKVGEKVDVVKPGGGAGATTQPAAPRGKGLMIAGAVGIGAGFVTWGLVGIAHAQLTKSGITKMQYDSSTWNSAYYPLVGATIGLWAVGAGLAVTGYLLHRSHHDEAPAMAVAPTRGGGILSLEWAR